MSRFPVLAALVGAAAMVVPAVASADPMRVDHGVGPTVAHDPSYADARIQVHTWSRDGSTTVRLSVNGLPAGRRFGAHLHNAKCGLDPLASGGHYQHSTDASVPLAEREIWLDVTSDGTGRAFAVAEVPWEIRPGARSVVVHAAPTNGDTGAAGARLLCTDVTVGE